MTRDEVERLLAEVSKGPLRGNDEFGVYRTTAAALRFILDNSSIPFNDTPELTEGLNAMAELRRDVLTKREQEWLANLDWPEKPEPWQGA